MKKLALLGILFIAFGLLLTKEDKLQIPITELLSGNHIEISLGQINDYYRDYDFSYVQNTTNFIPNCKQDLLNIYYTIINAGKDEFTFYCSKDYENCINDLEAIANDEEALSTINNYVHPYNEFKHIETEYDNYGKIKITIQKSYTKDEIAEIEQILDNIEQNIIKETNSIEENIKVAHDYIITNSKYDIQRRDNNNLTYKSDLAYGPLLQGYSICSGYTDAMQLILERLNVENFKVTSRNHIWNAVKLNNIWYHLDLTWDDPIVEFGPDILSHNYYLISTHDLLALDITEHTFNQEIYSELKEA